MDQQSAILELDNALAIDMSGADLNTGSAANELQFKDYPREASGSSNLLPIGSKQNFANSRGDDGPTDENEDAGLMANNTKTKAPASFWQLNYFSQYFNVTTQDVLARILWSVLPIKSATGANYIERHIQNNADIYGPFWINVTLIFSIAIFGNIANYLSTSGEQDSWHNDWNKLGLAASSVFSYTLFVPVLLWFFFWFRGCTITYTLFEIICAYGYSLSVYIPISFLWIIEIRLLQYILVIVGAFLSGSVLTMSFAPIVNSDPSQTFKTSYFMLLLIIGLHSLIAFSFLFYFF
ncbi:protein YIPF1 [Tetranychus urticae]|uniref:Protein YIPF n=1 Tax=Tetranychus urticae TaxID=32264 RepID=T1K4G4_TETUR|nr:protein YIPF1 [Tetranychus urticae]